MRLRPVHGEGSGEGIACADGIDDLHGGRRHFERLMRAEGEGGLATARDDERAHAEVRHRGADLRGLARALDKVAEERSGLALVRDEEVDGDVTPGELGVQRRGIEHGGLPQLRGAAQGVERGLRGGLHLAEHDVRGGDGGVL